MKLITGKEVNLTAGFWFFNTKMAAGTASFETSIDDADFVELDGSAVVASDNGVLHLPECKFKAILGGDAVSNIVRI